MIKPFTLCIYSETIRKMPENYCVAIWLADRHRWVLDLDKGISEEDADLIFHALRPLSGCRWAAGCDWVDTLNVAWSIREKYGKRFELEPVKVRDDITPFVICEQNHSFKLVGGGLTYVPIGRSIREALQYARLVKRLYDSELISWKVARRNLNNCPDFLTVERKINAARVAFWPELYGTPTPSRYHHTTEA